MVKPYEPEQYKDEYQQRLRDLIATKIEGKEIVAASGEQAAPADNVINFMEALQKSIEKNKKDKEGA